jgi:surface carbohydrate biosynthesis protein
MELKAREYIPKLFLSYQLIKNFDCKIIFGDKKFLFLNSNESNNIIYFYKGSFGKTEKLRVEDMTKKNFFFDIDEEGPISIMLPFDKITRLEKDIINTKDINFIWGENCIEFYKKKMGNSFIKKKTLLFGHPKFDLLKKPFINFYSKEVELIKKKYKKMVFMPSTSWLDSIAGDERLINYIPRIHKISIDKYKYIHAYEKLNYFNSIKLFKMAAEKNKDYNFIFRPHPGQDIHKVKKSFGSIPKNLHIVFEYSVTPWIIASDLFIHNDSNTAFEAFALKKKIIKFQIISKIKYFYRSIKIGITISDVNKGLNLINKLLYKKNTKPFNKNWGNSTIYNLDKKKFFYKNFITFIKKNKKKYNHRDANYKMHFNYLNQSWLKKTCNNFLSKIKTHSLKFKWVYNYFDAKDSSFFFNKSLKDDKFPGLTKGEIINDLKKFSNIEKVKFKFNVLTIDKNVFLISKKKF